MDNALPKTGPSFSVRGALFVFAAAFLIQSFVFLAIQSGNPPGSLEPDSFAYLESADDFRKAGGHFRTVVSFVWPPGYPFLLAVTASAPDKVTRILRLQHLFAALIAVLLYYFLSRVVSASFALGWSVLFSLDLVLLKYTNQVMTEAFFLFCFVSSLFLMDWALRKGRVFSGLALCGLLQGIAVLIRPVAVLWPIFQALFLIVCFRGELRGNVRSFLRVLAAVLVYLCVSAGLIQWWSYHNWQSHGQWTVAKTGTDVMHIRAKLILMQDLQCSEEEAHRFLNEELSRLAGTGTLTHAERDRWHKRILVQTAWKHPLGFVKAELKGLRKIFFTGVAPEFAAKGTPLRWLHQMLVHLYTAWNIVIVALGLMFALRTGRKFFNSPFTREKGSLIFCILWIGYFAVMASPGGVARYRFPFLPALYFLAALGFHALREARRKRYNLKGQPS